MYCQRDNGEKMNENINSASLNNLYASYFFLCCLCEIRWFSKKHPSMTHTRAAEGPCLSHSLNFIFPLSSDPLFGPADVVFLLFLQISPCFTFFLGNKSQKSITIASQALANLFCFGQEVFIDNTKLCNCQRF